MRWLLGVVLMLGAVLAADAPACKLVHPGADGKLVYLADEQGDTLPDFSNCGYRGGGVELPRAEVRANLSPVGGDETARIQAALDTVAKLPRGADGLRGAVLLAPGTYTLAGQLKLAASGVVLRGAGPTTKLVATAPVNRALVLLGSADARPAADEPRDAPTPSVQTRLTDDYVPVGAHSFNVADASGFKVGDTVLVRRASNAEWIHFIAMDRIVPRPDNPASTKQWTPFNLDFDRVITALDGHRVTVDAPLVCAIEARWGGGQLTKFAEGRVEQVGVEQLSADSAFDRGVTAKDGAKTYFADEAHASYLVSFGKVRNAWARGLETTHFAHGVAALGGGCKWVTVEDCRALDPVSQLTGGRRYPFNIGGQLCLVRRCYARGARHSFALGARVCGPNAFVDCRADEQHATSEPHHRWSVGGLFDNVHANIAIQDRQYMGSGHGWAGANYVCWNCEGSLVCQQPPGAQNWAIGQVGRKEPGAFRPRPDGYWESLGTHVAPASLYAAQLQDRAAGR